MKRKNFILYRFIRPIFLIIFKVLFNPTIVNKEFIPSDSAAVLAGNHLNALDPLFVDICTKRTVRTLAKKSLHDGKVGWFFRGIGSIPVDTNAKSNKNALDSAIDALQQGYLVNVSPEGTRNRTSEILLPFKKGAVVMAQRTNSLIIPYSITGTYKFRSKDLKITFGKPLDVSSASLEDANNLLYETIKKQMIESVK